MPSGFPTKLAVLLFWWLPSSWLRLSARWMFAIWIAQQCFVIWQQTQGYGSVSGAAHLGGVVVGFIGWLIFRSPTDSTKGSIFER